MKKKVAIIQSCYIPWRGYFDIIRNVDTFILLDDVQYTRRDWRNRNQIKTLNGLKWLTIPVSNKGKYGHQKICEIEVSNKDWAEQHWNQIRETYKKSPYYNSVAEHLQKTYEAAASEVYLSRINRLFLENICILLEIKTHIRWSTDFFEAKDLDSFSSSERLLNLTCAAGGKQYISGSSAKDYLDQSLFKEKEVEVCWFNYPKYPEYTQLHDPFNQEVSVVDTLMMMNNEKKYE